MCGIAGSWRSEMGDAGATRSLAALAHRGPDDHGVYRAGGGGVVLLHTRLSIIDLSPAGHQPMLSRDGRVALTFNGEIYNYRELMAELEADGVVFRGHSDTEVLLELYLRDGLAMLPRLNGIFAFAIHDARSGELLLVRDGLGVKPLYYAEFAGGMAFASEIKALLPLMEGGAATAVGDAVGFSKAVAGMDAAALERYLTYLWCPGEGTPLQGVRKLPPGTALTVKDGKVVGRHCWYNLPARRGVAVDLDARSAIGAVRDALLTAVQRQLVADVPVGAFLSGGLDSSAIVAFAREQVPGLRCFSIESGGGVDAGEADDLPYARRVAQHLGVPLDVVRMDAVQMAADLEQMVWQLDEPLADPAPLNVLYISRLARRHGIKVLLSGAGGDDLFTGYRRHLALRYERCWSWLPASVRRGLAQTTARLDQRSGVGRRLARLFAGAALDGDARLVEYFKWARRADLLPLFTPALRVALAASRAEQPMLDYLAGMPAGTSRIERMLALEQRFFLADHNLIYTDKMSMAAGVEVRVPFLDQDLVELAARIPDRCKQHGRIGKWVLKKAMEPYLPHDVIYRPKTGFGAPLRRWMRHELREMLGDHLSEASLRRRGLFDPAAVQRLIADNDAGRKDAAYTLLSLLCIEIWCRRFAPGVGMA
ncbi:MAG TPA: asparagine synthase (glutamine-hydrolyzing) [Rhodanobacteraceae bacterium]|nr:asparagine synthase (glutamine-hydrolyzing) [Rhodanobacteraceae bacterium]